MQNLAKTIIIILVRRIEKCLECIEACFSEQSVELLVQNESYIQAYSKNSFFQYHAKQPMHLILVEFSVSLSVHDLSRTRQKVQSLVHWMHSAQ